MTDKIIANNINKNWLVKQPEGHLIFFYNKQSELLKPLSEFIYYGIQAKEICIVIAQRANIIKINQRLNELLINADKQINKGQYIVLDANTILKKIMLNGLPNKTLFLETFNQAFSVLRNNYPYKKRKIRVYGELTATFYLTRNLKGIIQLESMWNELANKQSLTLFCGYPKQIIVNNQRFMKKLANHHDNQITMNSLI